MKLFYLSLTGGILLGSVSGLSDGWLPLPAPPTEPRRSENSSEGMGGRFCSNDFLINKGYFENLFDAHFDTNFEYRLGFM